MGFWCSANKKKAHKGDQVTLSWGGAPTGPGTLRMNNNKGEWAEWDVKGKTGAGGSGSDDNVHIVFAPGETQHYFLVYREEGKEAVFSSHAQVSVVADNESVDWSPTWSDIGLSWGPVSASEPKGGNYWNKNVLLRWNEGNLRNHLKEGDTVHVNNGYGKEYPITEEGCGNGSSWTLKMKAGQQQKFYLVIKDATGKPKGYSNNCPVMVLRSKDDDAPVWSDFGLSASASSQTHGEAVMIRWKIPARAKDLSLFLDFDYGSLQPLTAGQTEQECHMLKETGEQVFCITVKDGAGKIVAFSNHAAVRVNAPSFVQPSIKNLGPKISTFIGVRMDEGATGGAPEFRHVSPQIEKGEKLKLQWVIAQPADDFHIDCGGARVPAQAGDGEVVVTPHADCNYTLHAKNVKGESTANIWVTVHMPLPPGSTYSYHVPLEPFTKSHEDKSEDWSKHLDDEGKKKEDGKEKEGGEKEGKEKEGGEGKDEEHCEFTLLEVAKPFKLFKTTLVGPPRTKPKVKCEYVEITLGAALEFSGTIKAQLPKKEEEVKGALKKVSSLFPIVDLMNNLTDLDHNEGEWEGGLFTGITGVTIEKGEKGTWGLKFLDIALGKMVLKVPAYGKKGTVETAEISLKLTGVVIEVEPKAGEPPEVKVQAASLTGGLEVPLFKLEFNEEGFFPCDISAKLKAEIAGGLTPEGIWKLAECGPEILVLVVAVVIEVAVFAWIMGDLIDSSSEMSKEGWKAHELADALVAGYREGLHGTTKGKNIKASDVETAKVAGAYAGAQMRTKTIADSLKGNASLFDAWLAKNEKSVVAQSKEKILQETLLPAWQQRANVQTNGVSELYWYCRNTLDRLQTSWFFYVGSTCPLNMGKVWVDAWRAKTNDLYLEEFVKNDTPENRRYAELVSGLWK